MQMQKKHYEKEGPGGKYRSRGTKHHNERKPPKGNIDVEAKHIPKKRPLGGNIHTRQELIYLSCIIDLYLSFRIDVFVANLAV